MRLLFLLISSSLFLFLNHSLAQKKVVIMGSSSAQGYGATCPPDNHGCYDSAWGNRLQLYFRQNTSNGDLDTVVFNIAQSGYDTYHEMPSDFVSPIPNRPTPDPNTNVTKALSYSPDVVIINLPSNDIYFGYAKKEVMDNFRTMFQRITSAGSKCYISTPQPRDEFSTAQRDSLRTLFDSTRNNFGNQALDFWTDLVTTDGTYSMKPAVSAGDAIHINNLGHYYLFQRVVTKQIFSSAAPLPLVLKDFQASNDKSNVILKWTTAQEEPNTNFDIQRSTDGQVFETLANQLSKGPGHENVYSWTDTHPLSGRNLYRIRLNENSYSRYSQIVSVVTEPRELQITKIYKYSPALLAVRVDINKSQSVVITIMNALGETIQNRSEFITAPSKTCFLPIENLLTGTYFLRIDAGRNCATRAFNK